MTLFVNTTVYTFYKCATIEKRLQYSFFLQKDWLSQVPRALEQVLEQKSKEKSSKSLHFEEGWGEGQGQFGGKNCLANFSFPQLVN